MATISLTAGMRNNLYALQSTQKLLDQTQTRLSTGKKVNSALDNSSSFFTAKSHYERATKLDGYKDGMSEAVQAINAADAGITGITALINSAIAVAESAKEADTGSGVLTQTVTLTTVTAGDVITIGGAVFTASTSQVGTGFKVGSTDAETAINLAMLINATTEGTNPIDATSVQGSTISLKDTGGAAMVATDVVIASANEGDFTEADVAASDEKAQLVSQYATLMSQLDELVSDANYKGTNLLKADNSANNLKVYFENNHELELKGMETTVSGLSLSATATNDWSSKANAQADIDLLEASLTSLTIKASDLSSNLSTITARQEFTDAMIKTLETGADNLTLADMNEEAANMLMLQTQQALGVNSLSLSAQSAQSVLRLF
ncbi:MAG: flagellin [Thermodesulfobacteriota bacterium]|nr:flagellin [Thermodesulfobacteriota bacterium]